MIDGSELNVTLGNIFEFKPRTFLFSAVVLPRFYSFDIYPTTLRPVLSFFSQMINIPDRAEKMHTP